MKYNGYTFEPVKQISMDFKEATNHCRSNNMLNSIFNKDKGTWDYDDFYKKIKSTADIFAIKELDGILVIPATNYLFEWED